MRQLFPVPLENVDPLALYRADARPAPAHRPWVLVNMVASVDGATAVDGVSGGLGGEGDKMMFRALRATPDAILVAGGTARAENYGPPVARPAITELRQAAGQAAVPTMAVVTGSANLDPAGRLFTNEHRPLVYTTAKADPDRVAALEPVADVISAGYDRADIGTVLADLAARGCGTVLVEGGPSFNGALAAEDVVDEWCISIAPSIVGGASSRLVNGPDLTPPATLILDRVLEHDGELFLRYRRASAD